MRSTLIIAILVTFALVAPSMQKEKPQKSATLGEIVNVLASKIPKFQTGPLSGPSALRG